MKSKINDLEEAARLLKAGVEWGALKIASRLKCLGGRRDAIQKAWSSLQNPDFYRLIGQDPTRLLADGILALEELIEEMTKCRAGSC
jgi:hypothetical protein